MKYYPYICSIKVNLYEEVYLFLFFFLLMLGLGYFYLFFRWKHLWTLEKPQKVYCVKNQQNDTLRVVMIGDSWAGMHRAFDNYLQRQLTKSVGCPVSFESKGKGGEKTKGIYQLLFEDSSYGTQTLISSGADYCVISAGINDAAANLGTEQYCHYYIQILEFLLNNQIKPVILEFPNVNIRAIYKDKPIKDLCLDFLKSVMTHSGMYDYSDYREALKSTLYEKHLTDHVIYVSAQEWNGTSDEINVNIFLEDQIHLNQKGYELLDSCIAQKIAKDYNNRRMPILSTSQ